MCVSGGGNIGDEKHFDVGRLTNCSYTALYGGYRLNGQCTAIASFDALRACCFRADARKREFLTDKRSAPAQRWPPVHPLPPPYEKPKTSPLSRRSDRNRSRRGQPTSPFLSKPEADEGRSCRAFLAKMSDHRPVGLLLALLLLQAAAATNSTAFPATDNEIVPILATEETEGNFLNWTLVPYASPLGPENM